MASAHVQFGPPGTLGAGRVGATGARPVPELIEQGSVIRPDANVMRRVRAIDDLAPESRTMTLLINTFTLCVDMFKLSMASMLAVFVPQKCPGLHPDDCKTDPTGPLCTVDDPEVVGCTTEKFSHDCTFEENFICLTEYNKFVLAWNFLCLFALIGHYFLVWRREAFMVRHLKENLEYSRLWLKDEISHYPTLHLKLHRWHRRVFYVSVFAVLMQLVNLMISAKLTFFDYYNGYKTFTNYFTNVLLLSLILWNCVDAAYVGLKHQVAYSAIGFEPVSYNAMAGHAVKGL